MPRFHCPALLATGAELDLPPGAARHVQVLRLQPGDGITLFNGQGGEFEATVARMGRSEVAVSVGAHSVVEREAARAVKLAPFRQQAFVECMNSDRSTDTAADCKRKTEGANLNIQGGGTRFYDLPACVEAFEFRKAHPNRS